MVQDLDLPVEIIVCPTVRDDDGLALSSRNQYLSAQQRQRALAISAALRQAAAKVAEGETNAETIRRASNERLRKAASTKSNTSPLPTPIRCCRSKRSNNLSSR